MVKLTDKIRKDQRVYREKYNKLSEGKISFDEFKPYASSMGVYAQRKAGTFMVRPRILSGIVSVMQLKKISEISKKFSYGKIHLTTRQDVQFHKLNMEDTPEIFDELLEVDLINKGAGGNSVRNVSCSPLSGVDRNEVFDVTQHSEAVTEYLLGLDNICTLPRKYKIAFSNSKTDTARATVSDLGFVAKLVDRKRGFEVYGAGGLGGSPSVSIKLSEFVSEEEILYYVKAMMDLFDAKGDRSNRNKARIRFIRYRLGDEDFIKLFNSYLDAVKETYDLRINIKPDMDIPESPHIYGGKDKRVEEQKNRGSYSLFVHPVNGDIMADDLDNIIRYAENLDYEIDFRLTGTQGVCIRNVRGNDVEGLLEIIRPFTREHVVENSVACTGASNCRIGLCNTNGLIEDLKETLENIDEGTRVKLPRIFVSGCKNSCGWHHIGGIYRVF